MRAARRRVLCVDDHDDTCFMLTLLLGQQGYEAVSAVSAGEALGLARQQRFDLYVLDARLPDGSGLELCSRLRALDPEARIVFYSGAAYERDRVAGLAMGAAAYVTQAGGGRVDRDYRRSARRGRCGTLTDIRLTRTFGEGELCHPLSPHQG